MLLQFNVDDPKSYHHKDIQIKDKVYHYVEEGIGNGPYVLLIHGFPESWYSWKYQIEFLVKKGYRIVAFDMPGYGQTKVEDNLENYTFKTIAEDIYQIFINHFKQNKVFVIAHDWGSFVGWELAYRYPENILGYISLSIPYTPSRGKPKTEREKAEANPVLGYQVALNEGNIEEFDKNIEKFLKSFYIKVGNFRGSNYLHVPLNKSLFEHFDSFDTSKSEYIDDNYLNYLISQFKIQGTKGPTNWYRTSKLNGIVDQQKPHFDIKIKCLQILGTKDFATAFKDYGKDYLKDCSTEVIHGGHWIHYFDHVKVNSLIEKFLTKTAISKQNKL
ncbi:alpha/beta-hydrolase [Neoconidiobolus thromboides FSU 785]|nr:alpha/beta-hydrolase [Neoconidiobolus thromboides FSU 785]